MKILISFLLIYFLTPLSFADEWKQTNKWRISCGIVDKDSLIVNGKQKKFTKNEFKIADVVFKLDKGDVGNCKTDKKPSGGFPIQEDKKLQLNYL